MKANCFELIAFARDNVGFANKFATCWSRKVTGEKKETTYAFSNDTYCSAITKFGDLSHITIRFGIRQRRRVAVL
jgi:hypothetical protein